MVKQQRTPALPEGALRIAVMAVTEISGLAQAALLVQEQADNASSTELTAATRHILRRIDELSDNVVFPILHTGTDAYNEDDLRGMEKLVGA